MNISYPGMLIELHKQNEESAGRVVTH